MTAGGLVGVLMMHGRCCSGLSGGRIQYLHFSIPSDLLVGQFRNLLLPFTFVQVAALQIQTPPSVMEPLQVRLSIALPLESVMEGDHVC